MANDSESEIDLMKETVDLSSKSEKEPKTSSSSGSMPILEAGNDFAGYRIIRKIAHGAMGVVYLAEDPKLRRKVALKVILTVPGMQATEDQVNRFLREAQSIAKLRHKRIVPVYEVNSFENCHYFTMEYIEGPTLEQFLVKNEITAAKAIEIVLAIAEGLQEAHEKNIVHRDVKPANIIMQNGESPMITDFGLAKILEHEQKLTMTGSMLGTPCYMSPEQARGDSDLDYRSDIFSLGVLLYEMVTEKLPFKGESYMKTILMVINGDYVSPRKIKPRLSRDVESIIKKALEKDREFRYESMIDFIDDCTRFQRGEVVTISRSGIYRKLYRDVMRQRNNIMMSIVIVLIIGYLLFQNFNQSQTVNEQIQDKERAKELAARRMEKIKEEKLQLELQGERLKRGTTSPEFTERFDNEKYFTNNWFTSWSPVDVKKEVAEIPTGKNQIITPSKIEGFSSSAIFSWKMKLPEGNKFIFFCGKPGADNKIIERPIFIMFHLIKNMGKNDGRQDRLKLHISFYESENNKPIVDRTNFNAIEMISSVYPLAVKIYELPENASESLNFSVKRHETFFEIGVKEKEGTLLESDKSFYSIFRISSAYYLNPSAIQCGFFVPDTNKSKLNLEKFRVDKWITGTSEIEINRIVEIYGKNDLKLLYPNLKKHQEQLEKARFVTENMLEDENLKYQLAKTSFLMGISYHRSLNYQGNKEDVKIISDCYGIALTNAEKYFATHEEKSTKTEYVNYEELYLSVLVQLAFLNIFQGDFERAGELIKKHREITYDNTPYNNWLWKLPDPIEKFIAHEKVINKLKLSDKYTEIFNFLRQFSFSSEAGESSDIKRFLKVLLKNSISGETYSFGLFDKFNSLLYEESNKKYLQEIVVKEFEKDIQKEKVNSSLVFSAIKAANKTFKVNDILFIGNYRYEKWSIDYPEKNTRSWQDYLTFLRNNSKEDSLFIRATKAFPEFDKAINHSGEISFDKLNLLVEDEAFRRKVLTNLLDDFLIESRQKTNGQVQALGAVFPIDMNMEQNRGGNINLSLEEEGIRITLITKDYELKNRYSGNMLSQQDSWELYFDFRREYQFLSDRPSAGLFKLSFIPTPDKNGLAWFYSEDNLNVSKLKVLSFTNPSRGSLQQNEITFLMPFSEITRISNNSNIKFLGFNAVLNLESKEKKSFQVLFPDVNKKIFSFTKDPVNLKTAPLLSDKDAINEMINIYQLYGDAYQDKIMIKKVIDNWLGIKSLKPLANDYHLKNLCDNFLMGVNENAKKGLVKKTIDDVQLFFDIKGILTGIRGEQEWKDLYVKNILDKNNNVLEVSLSLIDKKNKVPKALDGEAFWDEIKGTRQFLKNSDANYRKNYWRFLENFLVYLKNSQPEAYEIARSFLMQLPDSDYNFREKAIACMVHGLILETPYYLRNHLESIYWKDDERVWIEYQLITKLSNLMDANIRLTDEDNKEKSNYFGQLNQLNKNLENDCALVLGKKMELKEFIAKYPLADSAITLINTLQADANQNKKVEDIRAGYEQILKGNSMTWMHALLKSRLLSLTK